MSRNEVKFQLSQILYTLGGTLTSCACSRLHYSASTLPGPGEPMRECVFTLMARFVAERSSYIGKPTAGLSPSSALANRVNIAATNSNSMDRLINGAGGPSTPTAPLIIPSGPGRKNGKHSTTLSLNLPLDFSSIAHLNVDLGPMIGWAADQDDVDEKGKKMEYPLGVEPGVSVLEAMIGSTPHQNGRLAPRSSSLSSNQHVKNFRSSTPPPRRERLLMTYEDPSHPEGQAQSRSAPPHFAAVGPLMARNAIASSTSPLGDGLGVARKWADVVGLNDHDGWMGRTGSAGVTGSLPKLQAVKTATTINGKSQGLIPSLLISPSSPSVASSSSFFATSSSFARIAAKRIGAAPPSVITPTNSSFADSLSSSLGLGGSVEEPKMESEVLAFLESQSEHVDELELMVPRSSDDMDVDIDIFEDTTVTVAAEESTSEVTTNDGDRDGGPEEPMIPPWARKRVKSAPTLSARNALLESTDAPPLRHSSLAEVHVSTETKEVKIEFTEPSDLPDSASSLITS